MQRYWSQSNTLREVDFIIQRENKIMLVEVNADTNIRSKSKKHRAFQYKIKLRVCFSIENIK